ncbi:MAG: TorD/DmsD family molecular chaperone [Gaiellales bacterium]
MELLRALAVLCEPPTPAHERIAAALELPGRPAADDHAELFLFQVYPYASVYLGSEGMLGGQARARVAGFWRALRLTPPVEPDHLAALLGLYASLAEAELAEPDEARKLLRRESRRALLWEHLLSWLPPYLAKVDELAPPFYRGWAELLGGALRREAEELGSQRMLPLHLREAPGLEAPEHAGATAFLESLLAPVRTGMILVRDDLARAARELGLGLRVAERRFMLRGLLAQDAGGTLAWLAGEAGRWCEIHARGAGQAGAVGRFWQERAEAAAALLDEVGKAAQPSEVSHA